ncbi:Hypothetical protein CINCED_3A013655 [Cinara cedri]|uniref:Uncharacterized protein n=1 Tax=Cinara cedri TaxID=506608 RepID=A0A5E4NRT0_9HEMI|nr:Hypothetical protein CINCED_3A013655 [Cinara cedri]
MNDKLFYKNNNMLSEDILELLDDGSVTEIVSVQSEEDVELFLFKKFKSLLDKYVKSDFFFVKSRGKHGLKYSGMSANKELIKIPQKSYPLRKSKITSLRLVLPILV